MKNEPASKGEQEGAERQEAGAQGRSDPQKCGGQQQRRAGRRQGGGGEEVSHSAMSSGRPPARENSEPLISSDFKKRKKAFLLRDGNRKTCHPLLLVPSPRNQECNPSLPHKRSNNLSHHLPSPRGHISRKLESGVEPGLKSGTLVGDAEQPSQFIPTTVLHKQ